ncbi:MAG: MFS transporter [Pseudomonadota bacterium]
MGLFVSFAALFLAVIFLQLSSGGVGTVDALTGLSLGFSTGQIGLLGSAHFAGFFVGCWWAPRLMGNVGYSRAFAVFTSLGAIGLLGHILTEEPFIWAALRVASGLCIAGCYTVIEAWLQAKVTNATRGRSMGAYRFVDLGGQLAAQLMIGALAGVELYMAYTILAIFCSASILPLALTRASPPGLEGAPRLHPLLAVQRSPLAVGGVIVSGLTSSAYRMVGPIYGSEIGLSADQVGLFLAAVILGGAVAQFPAGWIADRYDRRKVLVGVSLASTAACGVSAMAATPAAAIAASALFGFVTLPVYSIAAAHAHDFTEDHERAELSAALLFYYAVGAIISPVAVSALIGAYGPLSFYVFIAAGHLALIVYSLLRMRRRPTAAARTSYVYAPRTSFLIGRLTGRARKAPGGAREAKAGTTQSDGLTGPGETGGEQ